MTAPALDVLPGLHAAVVAVNAITSRLGQYNGGPAVHTRVPVPPETEYPACVIGPIIARTDQDGVNSARPIVAIDVKFYGEPTSYRDIETMAELAYGLFHRQRTAIVVPDYQVADIRCSGPIPAPGDDNARIARRVTLTIFLVAN